MHILFYRYGSICEPDIIAALKSLGHSVTEITEEIYHKDISAQQCMAIVSQALLSSVYDMVFSLNFYPVISEVCRIMKVLYTCWIVDSPVLELYSHSVCNPYNRIFLFDKALFQEFSFRNPSCIFYHPLAANVEHWDAVCSSITEEDIQTYSSDISFIGSLYTEKCLYYNLKNPPEYLKGYLDGLIEAQLKVYGYNLLEDALTDEIVSGFKKYIDFYQFPEKSFQNDRAVMAHLYLGAKVTEQERIRLLNALARYFYVDIYTRSDTSSIPAVNNKGGASTQTEMPKIFRLSKINLNMTSKPIRTGLPLRIWDILGAGGFLISNYQEEIPEYFEIGKDLEVYTSKEDLLEKVQYYLKHEEERKAIAENGYQKVKKYHAYPMRVDALLKIALSSSPNT